MKQQALEIMPIMNAPPNSRDNITISYDAVRIMMPYSFRGQTVGIRLITTQKEEFLIVFKSEKHYDKAMQTLTRSCTKLDPDF